MYTAQVFELKKIGLDKKRGLLRYSARIKIKDDVTGEFPVDTRRTKIYGNNIGEAREQADAMAEKMRRDLDGGRPTRGHAVLISDGVTAWLDSIERYGTQ